MKAAIVYTTLGGNTEDLAYLIAHEMNKQGVEVDLFNGIGRFGVDFRSYDIVLFGSYTWGDGELPLQMRKYLRQALIENKEKRPLVAAVFGTGDTQYKFYCRAVDEMRYHLQKNNVIVLGEPLKLEQSCRGSQLRKMQKWTNSIIGAFKYEN